AVDDSSAIAPPGEIDTEPTTRCPVVSRSTFPPDRGTPARYSTRSSSTIAYRLCPPGAHAGSLTARSSEPVRSRASPPVAGTTASLRCWYAQYFATSPCRYAIHLPSGLHAIGPVSAPGYVVTAFGSAPAFASTTKMSVLLDRSASGPRLLTNAMRVPSGDQAGWLSS